MSELLENSELGDALKRIPSWDQEGKTIHRLVEFDEFMDAIDFVNLVAEIAEEAQHHPDLDIRYNRVNVSLTTHDAGGLTDADIEVAQRIDNLVD
jgi:4a-hydroxytetrahydrobiopterin dehydratase